MLQLMMTSSLPFQSPYPDVEGEEVMSIRSIPLAGAHIYLVVSLYTIIPSFCSWYQFDHESVPIEYIKAQGQGLDTRHLYLWPGSETSPSAF